VTRVVSAAGGLLRSLAACTDPMGPTGPAAPASYERSFAAATAAMRDRRLPLGVDRCGGGTVVGMSDAGM
jgi:hypothetical protein